MQITAVHLAAGRRESFPKYSAHNLIHVKVKLSTTLSPVWAIPAASSPNSINHGPNKAPALASAKYTTFAEAKAVSP